MRGKKEGEARTQRKKWSSKHEIAVHALGASLVLIPFNRAVTHVTLQCVEICSCETAEGVCSSPGDWESCKQLLWCAGSVACQTISVHSRAHERDSHNKAPKIYSLMVVLCCFQMFDISNRRTVSFYLASKMANYFRSVGRDESQFRVAVRLAVPGKVISHIAAAYLL